jgi:carboxymethylenebutenolidase
MAEERKGEVTRREFLEQTALGGASVLAAEVIQAGQTSAKLRGEMVEYESGDLKIPAYLSLPKKQPAPAVMVIHEVFGLNDHIKTIADRVAQEGYVALAPNLFVRAPEPPPRDASNVDAIRRAASSLAPDVAARDMQAGLNFLKAKRFVKPRFGSVGFCMGGGLSYRLAASGYPELACAVIFYGRTPLELVDKVTCPLLGIFGELDRSIPPQTVREFEEALRRAGKKAEIRIYPGAKHGFFNDTRPEVYDAQAAADAWQRTLRFFREHLGA